jgi:hypothetical protein
MQINADSEVENCAINALEKKTKLLAKTGLAYWRRRVRKQPNSPNWFVEVSARGMRRKLSLDTPNRENAAARARDIYQIARAAGWDAVQAKYWPNAVEVKNNLSVGQFIALAESVANVEKVTWRGYVAAFRRIVSDLFDLDLGKKEVRSIWRRSSGVGSARRRREASQSYAAKDSAVETLIPFIRCAGSHLAAIGQNQREYVPAPG